MSENNTTAFSMYELSFKDPTTGEWIHIPNFYTGIYEAYKAYCVENNITYVTEDVYYQALATLGQYGTFQHLLYNAYVAYCNSQDPQLTPVSENTYYATLGSLKNLVESFQSSTGNVAALASALEDGVLPTALGGTGQAFSTTTDLEDYIKGLIDSAISDANIPDSTNPYGTLIDALTDILTRLSSAEQTVADHTSAIDTINNTSLPAKLDANKIAYGTTAPTDPNANIPVTAEYYFQISQ